MKKFSDLKSNEVLALAIKIEDRNANLYEEWADRFRPYSEKISQLLDEMSQEEILHRSKLEHLFYRKFHADPADVIIPIVTDAIEVPKLPLDHFFVVDENMAEEILRAALNAEIDACCFYKKALKQTTDPTLHKLYLMLSGFEDEHVRKLVYRLSKYQEKISQHEKNNVYL